MLLAFGTGDLLPVFLARYRRLNAFFSGPLQETIACFSGPTSLKFSARSAILELMGAENERGYLVNNGAQVALSISFHNCGQNATQARNIFRQGLAPLICKPGIPFSPCVCSGTLYFAYMKKFILVTGSLQNQEG